MSCDLCLTTFMPRRYHKLKLLLNKFVHERANYHQPDKFIIAVVLIFVVFGLVMLSSASSAISFARYSSAYVYFYRQFFGVVFGLFIFFILSKFDYHRFRQLAAPLLVVSIGLLLIVFLPWFKAEWGTAQSWIHVWGFSVQPSEFVKLSFLLYLAAWLESRGEELIHLHHGTMPFLIVLGLISLLMLLQPDTGTLFIILTTSLIVYFIAGGNLKHIFYIFLIGLAVLAGMLKFISYQADRLRCFLDVSFSPENICYQINQALIAIGSGGFWGRGFGASRQKFKYLPEAQGDAIFPIISEELGFLLSVILILLFAFLFYRGYLVAQKAPDMYGKILAIGIVFWLTIQAFINIAGMVNLIPMTGVPLPFISYGGSAMVASLAAAGILVNISKQTKS